MEIVCDHCGQQNDVDDEKLVGPVSLCLPCARCNTEFVCPASSRPPPLTPPAQRGDLPRQPFLPKMLLAMGPRARDRSEDTQHLTLSISLSGVPPFRLSFDTQVTIGQDPGNALPLQDPQVSRNHARITVRDVSRSVLEDLPSTNGTFVNGGLIQRPTVITPMYVIQVSSYELRLVPQTLSPPKRTAEQSNHRVPPPDRDRQHDSRNGERLTACWR